MRVPRDNLLELAVVAATASAVATCIVLIVRLAPASGDILGFLGGAIGSGLAVVGALWIERRKDRETRRRQREILTQSLSNVAGYAYQASRSSDHDVVARSTSLKQAFMTFNRAVDSIPIYNPDFHNIVMNQSYWAANHVAKIDAIQDSIEKAETAVENYNELRTYCGIIHQTTRLVLGANGFLEGAVTRLDEETRRFDQQVTAGAGAIPSMADLETIIGARS